MFQEIDILDKDITKLESKLERLNKNLENKMSSVITFMFSGMLFSNIISVYYD